MNLIRFLGFMIFVGLGAEFGARLDDRLFENVPMLANPRYEDLITHDELGRHGKPFAKFKKWRLNNFGFRGPDTQLETIRGCRRVMILGASESFGLYESPDAEYPALLRQDNDSCVEILNTAIAGMTLPSITDYWNRWLKRFKPDDVLIYPSPLFYLSDAVPVKNTTQSQAKVTPDVPAIRTLRSRFFDRLRDRFNVPAPLQISRNKRYVQAIIAAKPAGWIFREIPIGRLDAFELDLDRLVISVASTGTRVHLLTHAIKFREINEHNANSLEVWDCLVNFPRAEAQIMVKFNTQTNERLRKVAAAHGIPTIDIAGELTDCQECFGDLIHFTDAGARRVADAVRNTLGLGESGAVVNNAF